MKITILKKISFNYSKDVLVHRHIKLENNTKVFAESFGDIMVGPILMLQFGLLKCFGLKRRYSVLFGLKDNFLATIQENISLIHNSISGKTLVSSGEKR